MVDYITRSALLDLGRQQLQENIQRAKKAAARTPNNSTFLSHSSKDDEVMPAVIYVLESHGASVYLDKLDLSLYEKQPRDIATTLRSNISVSKKFVVFASDNVRDSKWVPWELGLADGFKNSANVALFPAPDKKDDYHWTEQEYLGVYDRIVYGLIKGDSSPGWIVWDQSRNSARHLRDWLTR